jgi:hypothetical protein
MWRILLSEWEPLNELDKYGENTKENIIEDYQIDNNDEAVRVWNDLRSRPYDSSHNETLLSLYHESLQCVILEHLYNPKPHYKYYSQVPIDKDMKSFLDKKPWESRSPKDELNEWTKEWSNEWKEALELALNRKLLSELYPNIPNICFLPMKEWYEIAYTIEDSRDVSMLAALGTWRYTQGIYRFHDNTYSELIKTNLHGKLPADILLKLPEWCVYIETPHGFADTDKVGIQYGFFAFFDYSDNITSLYIVTLVFGDTVSLTTEICVCIGDWDIKEGIKKGNRKAYIDRHNEEPRWQDDDEDDYIDYEIEDLSPYLSLLLYLCSKEPEIKGSKESDYPNFPAPKKVKSGLKLFPAEKPKIWNVGDTIGEMLRLAKEQEINDNTTKGKSQEKRRSHIRRGHWHGYWTGPMKPPTGIDPEKYKRCFDVKWLHPMLVTGFDKTNSDEIQTIENDE